MEKEAEILESASRILERAMGCVLHNDTAWKFLYSAEKHLQKQFKARFDVVYREESILEAETLEA